MQKEYDVVKASYKFQKKALKSRYLELVRKTAHCDGPEQVVEHLLETEDLSVAELGALKSGLEKQITDVNIAISRLNRYRGESTKESVIETHAAILTNGYKSDQIINAAKAIGLLIFAMTLATLPLVCGTQILEGFWRKFVYIVVIIALLLWDLFYLVENGRLSHAIKNVTEEATQIVEKQTAKDQEQQDRLVADQQILSNCLTDATAKLNESHLE